MNVPRGAWGPVALLVIGCAVAMGWPEVSGRVVDPVFGVDLRTWSVALRAALSVAILAAGWRALSSEPMPGYRLGLVDLLAPPVAFAGAYVVGGYRHLDGLTMDEYTSLPWADQGDLVFFAADLGIPSLVHNLLLVAARYVGGLELVAAAHALLFGVFVAAVWTLYRRLLPPALAVAAIGVAVLHPDVLFRFAELRAYPTFLAAIAAAACAALGSGSARWALVLGGVACLDNPLCLAWLGGLAVGAWWQRPDRGLALGSWVGLFTLAQVPAIVGSVTMHGAGHVSVRQTGGALGLGGNEWTFLLASAAVALLADGREGGLRRLAAATWVGALAVVVATAIGLLPPAAKLSLFVWPAALGLFLHLLHLRLARVPRVGRFLGSALVVGLVGWLHGWASMDGSVLVRLIWGAGAVVLLGVVLGGLAPSVRGTAGRALREAAVALSVGGAVAAAGVVLGTQLERAAREVLWERVAREVALLVGREVVEAADPGPVFTGGDWRSTEILSVLYPDQLRVGPTGMDRPRGWRPPAPWVDDRVDCSRPRPFRFVALDTPADGVADCDCPATAWFGIPGVPRNATLHRCAEESRWP